RGGTRKTGFHQPYSHEIYPKTVVETDKLEGVFSVYYLCTSCRQHEICFLLKFCDGKVSKVGQSPSPFAFMEVPTSMRKALGSELEIYRKGLMNESVGIGVGAFAYYRRIIENRIAELLNEIALVAGVEYQDALKTLKASYNASQKIEVVKDLLPDRLKINGSNP